MTRPFGVLVALLLASSLAAATPIAPLPPHIGPIPYDDVVGRSATNGDTTLAVWTNASSYFPNTWHVYGRLLTRDGTQGPSFSIGAGLYPRVATNGTDYLVAHSAAGSRFQMYPFDNVFVRLVHADGTLGPQKAIHRSLSARVDSVLWTGTHWLVGFVGPSPQIAILDASLEVRTIALEGANGAMLERIGARTWAFVSTSTGVAAIEVLANGDLGERRELAGVSLKDVVETAQGVHLVVADATNVLTTTFDGDSFATPVPLFDATLYRDAAAWNDTLVVLHQSAISIVNDRGEIVERVALDSDATTIEPGAEELMLFGTASGDLFARRIRSLQPADIGERERVSEIDIAVQRDPLLASNGTHAVAFWNQTIDGQGTLATFSRAFDAGGAPLGGPVQLPFTFAHDADVVFDGDHFVLVWTRSPQLFAITVSADGKTAGSLQTLGNAAMFSGEPSIAASDEGTFVVWRGSGDMIRGTAIRDDASPVVPGGFELLPSFSGGQSAPEIVEVSDGFLVFWKGPDIHSATISAQGNIRSLSHIAGTAVWFMAAHAGSSTLVAWPQFTSAVLFAMAGDGRPFEAFDPHWENWRPLAIVPNGANRYRIAIDQVGVVSTTEIETSGAFITNIAPLRRFGAFDTYNAAMTFIGGSPLAIAQEGKRLVVVTAPVTKRRAARN